MDEERKDIPSDRTKSEQNISSSSQDNDENIQVDQSFIDSLFASAQQVAEQSDFDKNTSATPTSTSSTTEKDSSTIAQEDVSAILKDKVITPPSHSKEVDLLTQEEIEELLNIAKQQEKERQRKKQEMLEKLTTQAPKIPEIKPPTKRRIPRKYITPITVGLIISILLFGFSIIYLMRSRVQTPSVFIPEYITNPISAKKFAELLIEEENFNKAIEVLEQTLEYNKKTTPEVVDIQFLLIKAKFLSGQIIPGTEQFYEIINEIEDLTQNYPDHPMVPYSLFSKARLHELDRFPYAALDTYKRLANNFSNFEKRDEVFIKISNLELELNNPVECVRWANELLRKHPESTFTPQAKFNIAESYKKTGLIEDARTLYVQVGDSVPDTEIGKLALLRLAEIAYDQGRYEQAIIQLSPTLQGVKNFSYNDEAYLLMAKSYRALGKTTEALQLLQDIITFFPPSEVHPKAWIELSQIYQIQGNMEKAYQIAEESARLYPNHPDVLANKAELLGLQGNTYASAITFIEAERNGGNNPIYLLKAGKLLALSNLWEESEKVLTELHIRYSGTLEATLGRIEKAKVQHQQGKILSAINELEQVKKITSKASKEYKETVKQLSLLYRELKMDDKAIENSIEWFQVAETDEEKIEAGISLLEKGQIEKIKEKFAQISFDSVLPNKTYQFLLLYGRNLLPTNPSEGLSILENAYYQYPSYRTTEHRIKLLQTYIDMGRTTSAQRIIQEWENELGADEQSIRDLIDAEILWANYLTTQGQWESALNAYYTAIQLSEKGSPPYQGKLFSTDYAKYKYASILMDNLKQPTATTLLEELSRSNSPIATLAKLKLEQINVDR